MEVWLVIAFLWASSLLCVILEMRSQQRLIARYRDQCDMYRERIKRIVRENKEEN